MDTCAHVIYNICIYVCICFGGIKGTSVDRCTSEPLLEAIMTTALAFGLLKVGCSSPFFEAFLPKGSLSGGAWEPQPNKGNSSDSGKRKSCLRATKRGTPFVDGQNPTSGRWFITVLIGLCFSTCFPTRTKEGDANKNGVFLFGFPSRPKPGYPQTKPRPDLGNPQFFFLF